MYLYRILAIASILSLVLSTSVGATPSSRRVPTPPPVTLTVDTQGMNNQQLADLRCMSLNIYYEARGTSFRNQLAVAMVVRNRQRITGQTACQVIYAPGQFTWTTHGRRHPGERDSWQLAQRIALLAMGDNVDDITRGATHFHENRLTPPWTRRAVSTVRIGAHTFHRIELAQAAN